MKRILFLGLFFLGVSSQAFAVSTDEWIGKAANAAANLASGNPEGAVQQMVPSYYVPITKQSGVNAGLGSANFHQQIPGLNQASSKLMGVSGAYNAGINYGPRGIGTPSHNVQVGAGNQYISNTTTFSPPLWRDPRDK